jgi:hypothetical protein
MSGNWPDFDAWLQTAWGAEHSFFSTCGYGGSVGFVFGQNPPYYLDDFLSVYPKFFGAPASVASTTITAGSSVIAVTDTTGLGYGQFLQGTGLDKGTVITGLGTGTITVNRPALADGAGVTLQVYENPPVPTAVIQLYLNLATASLVQRRWEDSWYIGIAWFVAHYLTLYAKSDSAEVSYVLSTSVHGEVPSGLTPGSVYTLSVAPPGGMLSTFTKNGTYLTPASDYTLDGVTITLVEPTVSTDQLYATWLVQTQTLQSGVTSGAQVAAQGLAIGIQTSKSVGDVSVGYQVLSALEDYAAWNLTLYGQQLATIARVIGAGPALIR